MIKASHISASYDAVEVLSDISFTVEASQSIAIIGPNGSGKTTLLRVLSNILPFTGEVFADGIDITRIKRRELAKKIGMLSQMTQLYFNYSVYETVMMGRYPYQDHRLFGVDSLSDREATEKALESVGISALKDRAVDELSGGQLQRVFLAKILAQNPDYVLLDEPTNHLDLSYQVELIRFLREWSANEGKTIIGVLHDLNLAMLLTDRFLLLDEGKIKAYDTIDTILKNGVLDEVYHMNVREYMQTALKRWE